MELIERDLFLNTLQEKFAGIAAGEGHCILIAGEAGIGKSSLIRSFCQKRKDDSQIYQGICDALYTPRPLAPFYDVALQMRSDYWQKDVGNTDRVVLFNTFFHELENRRDNVLIVFEDIHWADEATLDFIKFLARRITRVRCLFLLTYRDNEVHSRHPLRNVLGQLPADSFTRLQLTPFSREAVEKLSDEKGYSGQDVYSISGGIPFYVNEILASYSPGIPDNIKDSILSVFNRQPAATKKIWEILSATPGGLMTGHLGKIEPLYAAAIEDSLDSKIVLLKADRLFFKHELYRRTIEANMSPLTRIALNKKILEILLSGLDQDPELERIIHHAKNANEYDLVVHYAPLAARQAASVGSHIEAGRLFLTAIEYYQGSDKDILIAFYEGYAYECYLTNRIKEAITYQEKALAIHKERSDARKTGGCMRFLSRIWWYGGNRREAENYADQAIKVLEHQPSSKEKAMAFSNMSQLKMLSNQPDECIYWGEKAIAIAKELMDEEILSHALNNVGTVLVVMPASKQKGLDLLQQSLEIALKNSYHEHAARAYTNLGSTGVQINDLVFAEKILGEGIRYCEERDLDSWTAYMSSCRARLLLRKGDWQTANSIAENIIRNEEQASIIKIGALVVIATIKMRKGENDALAPLLEAKEMAFTAMELQRVIPVLVALLEYEWLTGMPVIESAALDQTISMLKQMGNLYDTNEFSFWLLKARNESIPLLELYTGYQVDTRHNALQAAELWQQIGCPYQQALSLFAAGEKEQRQALTIVYEMGAGTVCQKLKMEMRAAGVKSLPRGIRATTMSNIASLTQREVDVLKLLKEGMKNKEIATRLFISAKTVDHHISAVLLKLDVNSRLKAVQEAIRLRIIN